MDGWTTACSVASYYMAFVILITKAMAMTKQCHHVSRPSPVLIIPPVVFTFILQLYTQTSGQGQYSVYMAPWSGTAVMRAADIQRSNKPTCYLISV